MSSYKDILELFDGTIDPEREAKLFSSLSYDENLRNDLKQHINISSAVENNVVNTAPPTAVKAGVFKSIGLQAPSAAKSAANAGATAAVMSFLQNNSRSLLAGLTATILTSALFLAFNNPESGDAGTSANSFPVVEAGPQEITMTVPAKPQVITKKEYIYKTNTEYIYVPFAVGEPVFLGTDPSQLAADESLTRQPGTARMDFSAFGGHDLTETLPIIPNPFDMEPETEFNHDRRFSLGFFGAAARHFPYPTIQPDRYINFTNMGANALYKISDNIKVGAQLRQETFHQKYEDEDRYFWQQPNFTTLCGVVRYTHDGWGLLKPYGQLAVGGNKVGLVMRPQFGLEFAPYAEVSFLLGGEYSFLRFHHRQSYFGAHKVGAIIGAEYKF